MAVDFTEPLPPASDDAIEEVEHSLGLSLPADYRGFLAEHNGGYMEENFLPPGDASVRYFYSAGLNDSKYIDDLVSALHRLYLPDVDLSYQLRTGFLPVGEDEGGNLVCLKAVGEDSGSVWLWSHDAALDEDPFERLSESFGEFFSSLRPISALDLETG